MGIIRLLVLASMVVIGTNCVLAQKKKFKLLNKRDQLTLKADSSFLMEFPNINKLAYYQNSKIFKKIVAYEKSESWEQLYPILEEYVKNFGIQNFSKDTYWIWRLAKLAEINGHPEKAKTIYKLVLKHHREGTDISKVTGHYDSLTAKEKDYYVELEYYYELVEYRKEIDTLRPPRGVLLNMGEEVNSDVADYGPTFSGTDDFLIFTSKRNEKTIGLEKSANEDIFFTTNSDGYWSQAKAFKGVNSGYNEGSACLSKDGKELFFARCNSPDSYGNCDLFVAKLGEDSIWSDVKNLGAEINSVSWDSHPSLSHSEDTLYFASDRIGGFGLSDIYYIVREGKAWSKPMNMGPVINTRGNELSPFYHHIKNILYFSSTGQLLNFGSFDIYKSYNQGVSWGEPKNIGPLVNGTGREYYFTIDSKSKNLFYAKSPEDDLENLDLHSFPLPMGAQPGATAHLEGSLVDEYTEEPFKGIVSIIDLDHGIEVAPKYLRPDGTFAFDLIDHNNYLVILQGEEFFRIEEVLYMEGDASLHKKTEHISSKLKFASLEFENSSAELNSTMYSDLDKMVNFLLDNPDYNLRISGHTDSDGHPELNLQLSKDRAHAIENYLIEFGNIEPERVQAEGYGSTRPIIEEENSDHKQLNRRVEFEIYRSNK